jgi:hypothetical protein
MYIYIIMRLEAVQERGAAAGKEGETRLYV